MSYRFCFGASGSGKSVRIHQEIIERAERSLAAGEDTLYLVLVPEQFSMQTQKELVEENPSRGIMNIEVLSFGRLAYRLEGETGPARAPVLDDTGKSLILRRVAASCRDSLRVLGGAIGRPGMIEEIKSVISEFKQYGIREEEIDALTDYARKGGQKALAARLTDMKVLYGAFEEARRGRYATAEETMDLLAGAIPSSDLIRRAVIVLDGFTGFTPVQNRVLSALMARAREVIFCLTLAPDGGPGPKEFFRTGDPGSEQHLFYLSRKTALRIQSLAEAGRIPRGEDLYLDRPDRARFSASPVLAHLEKNLFRPHGSRGAYEKEPGGALRIFAASTPDQEVAQILINIRRMVRDQGYAYRDFAVVSGDLETYGDLMDRCCRLYEVPVYIDRNRDIRHNPLSAGVRAALAIPVRGYDYESIFRYLRTGLSTLTREETDRLENYCLEKGIRARKHWKDPFDADTEPLRLRLIRELSPLFDLVPGEARRAPMTVAERTRALYDFVTGLEAENRMALLAAAFEAEGDTERQLEYEQIYRSLMRLLDQLYSLAGPEKISARDYLELVETGLDEIRLGTLPQLADRVLCGDIERTRLSEVRVVFFAGLNDGIIPRAASRGGLLSDLDREFLLGAGTELSPTPRQQMYIQRLYLYLNMTKPRTSLILSFSRTSREGGSLRPSFMVREIRRLFPLAEVELPEAQPPASRLTGRSDSMDLMAGCLRDYASGSMDRDPAETEAFMSLYGFLLSRGGTLARDLVRLREAAFIHYHPESIRPETAGRLYGTRIRGSVSRLELASQCMLRQFLRYGLALQERRERQVESRDTGSILHESLQRFTALLGKEGLTWTDFTPDQARALVREALFQEVNTYRDRLVYTTERSSAGVGRMERILTRTVMALQYQIRKGSFTFYGSELPFGEKGVPGLTYELEGGSLELRGRIDRVDLAEEEGRVYVKVLDYKSGLLDLDRDKVRRGLQLQLITYMEAMREFLGREKPGKEILPAAMLYYRMKDPMVPAGPSSDDLPGENPGKILEDLRPTGMVLAELDTVLRLDAAFERNSDVIRVTRSAGGDFRESHTYTREEYQAMADQVRETMVALAEEILKGASRANPARIDKRTLACTYCPYAKACVFDPTIPGCSYRED